MKTFIIWTVLFLVFVGLVGAFSTCFPGTNPVKMRPGTDETTEMAESLKTHVEFLTQDLGARDKPNVVEDAALYMAAKLGTFGPEVKQIDGAGGKTLVCEVAGGRWAKEVVLVCSHFDGPRGSPGADAGAAGAAVRLEVARMLGATGHERTLRVVLFPDGAARAGKPDAAASQYDKACGA